MLKKIFVSLSLFVVMLGLTACGKTTKKWAVENMAEITKEYYFGENDDVFVTLAVGEREKDYLLNGQATELVNFSLLSLKFKEDNYARAEVVQVVSNDSKVDAEAKYNSFNDSYMVDIVDDVEIGESVSVVYEGETIVLKKQNFAVDYEKAIEIATNELKEKLDEQKSFNHFEAECYLRVMSEKDRDFGGLYWCFTCLNYEGESFSVVISTSDGKILANSLTEEGEGVANSKSVANSNNE